MRRLLVAGAFLCLVALVAGIWSATHRSAEPVPRGMASATVVSTSPAGDGSLEVTATYDASGRHTVKGTVDAGKFTQDGRIVWVCYVPSAPGDTGAARLRLPTDDLCGQK